MTAHLLPALTLFALTLSSCLAGLPSDASAEEAPVMLALQLGQLGNDDVTERQRDRDRARLGTSDRVFGPVRPPSRLGSYTGRGLGSYTGSGLGSYTGSGLGGSTTHGTGAGAGTGTGTR